MGRCSVFGDSIWSNGYGYFCTTGQLVDFKPGILFKYGYISMVPYVTPPIYNIKPLWAGCNQSLTGTLGYYQYY
jgi:hypothetical protein